ncbi:MAG: hypothetical protein U0P45_13820 [Acidimicrobiales bacterium]
MQELAAPVPELVDVVPADQADALVAATRASLAALAQEAEELARAADAAEREAQAMGADPVLLGRATEAAQRFIDELRDRTDAELRTILDDATDRSRRRIDEARAEADRIRTEARALGATAAGPSLGAAQAEPAAPTPGEPLWLEVPGAEGPSTVTEVAIPADPTPLAAAEEPMAAGTQLEVPVDAAATAAEDREQVAGPAESPAPTVSAAAGVASPLAPPADPEPAISDLDLGGEGDRDREGDVMATGSVPSSSPSAATATIAAPKAVWPPVEPPPWTVDPGPEAGTAEAEAPAADAATTPASGSKLGSVPVYALLQVVGLVVVLIVLLAFVN